MTELRNPNMNLVVLSGRLTRDAELQYLPNGTALCKLGLAINEYYRKDGERKERVHFIDVVVWGKAAEWCGDSMKKGHDVVLQGKLVSEEWTDKQTGQNRKTMKVYAGGNGGYVRPLGWHGSPQQGASQGAAASSGSQTTIDDGINEDDIPF